ncbi:hypothetical protein LTR10_009913 [Elasticomyces elasticus]|nr:hypothetical protein LTR10_009913 [Elasticomyces elasticus]KAK4970203.1 hypothetical protein LTR42_008370 [Elasticomyces elasticus]
MAVETSNAASQQVFDTLELLEAILIFLPIKDILVNANRVCKDWRDTIEGSPRLRHALFFTPLPGKPMQFINTAWTVEEDDEHSYSVIGNPWVDDLVKWARGTANSSFVEGRGALAHPWASWRRMLVCQPPVLSQSCLGRGIWCNRKLDDADVPRALRFQDLVCKTCLPKGLAGNNFCDNHIIGRYQWRTVQCGNEVKRIVRPKGSWLLPAASKNDGKQLLYYLRELEALEALAKSRKQRESMNEC